MRRIARPATVQFIVVFAVFAFANICLLIDHPSQARAAALGEKETAMDPSSGSSGSPGSSMTAGTIRIQTPYTVKDTVSNSIPVREYLTRDGTVFGLAWKGRNHPDFAAILGSFYSEYQDLNSHRDSSGLRVRGGRRTLQGAHLILEKFGHMGALKGRAIIPSLMPAGVQFNDIK